MRGAAHRWLPQSLRSRRRPFEEGSRSAMMGTAVLLLIPFFIFLVGYYLIVRNETKATLRVHRNGTNGTGPRSLQADTSRSAVPSPMTDTVRFSFMTAERSMPTPRSSAPEILLQTLTARSNGHHPPLPPEAYPPIAVTETSRPLQDAVSRGFLMSQDAEECADTVTTSGMIRPFSFSDWLRRPYCRHSA